MPASAAPFSDAFNSAGAIDIAGTRGTTTSPELGAKTREAGEPTVPGSNTDHTVWTRFIPAASGFVRFSTCAQTGMNPVPGLSLGLYTGSQVNLLTTVSQATNNCPAGFENAVLGPVAVTAGTYYWLQIGGSTTLNAGETDMALTMDFNAALPVNDDWASALLISGALPQTFAANNGLATTEVGEPRSDATTERQSLWYRWTATATGSIAVSTCGSPVENAEDPRIGVFTGTTPAVATDMTFLDENDDGCPGAAAKLSRVFVPVTNGTKYWFKLSNNTVDYGFPYSLQIKWVTTPENSVIPSIYPTAFKVGTATNADSTGTWGGSPTPVLTNQWRRCDAAGSNCTNISGATGGSYTPVAGDIGFTIVLRVTATNSNGATSADSLPSNVVDVVPANDLWANATNLGTGSSVSFSDDNNWATHNETGEPSIGPTLARNTVWYRWTPATSATYVINNCLGGPAGFDFLDLMIGIRTGAGPLSTTTAVGTGDNGCGAYHSNRTSMLFAATAGTTYWIEVASKTASVTGNFTLSIEIAGNPQVTVMPSISGTAAPGGVLNLDIGDWISPVAITPVIHWLRCDSAGNGCVDTGQSGTAYTVVPADSGGKMKATVALTNPYGSVTNFALSAVIAQDSDGDGILDGADTCPSEAGNRPNGCMPSDIVGAGIPSISGNLVTGQTLTSSTGTWTVLHDPLGYSLSYQWQRCNDATPGSCSNIGGATGNTYALVAGDLTKTIRVGVTATNADDAALQYSMQSIAVTSPPPPPSNSTPPAVTGTKIVGQTLSTTDGTWTPAGVTFTYAWSRCTDNVSVGTCTAIPSETASSYTLVAADLGKYIRSQVTGQNPSGSSSVFSAATSIVLGDDDGDGVPNTTDVCPAEAGTKPNGCLPSDIVAAGAPSVTGTLVVGQTVSASGDNWTVLHDPLGYSLSYQWQRCNDATAGSCSNIAAANSNTYVLTGAEYQKRVRVIVTATNADDFATQNSSNSAAIDQVPGNTVAPALSGTPRVTAALSTTQGTWTPAGATFAYSWLRCTDNVSPASCAVIPSQTGTSYTLAPADDGKYIRSRVTGTTTAGSIAAESAPSAKVITDGDADGVPDATDVCPAEAGTKPNGCLLSDIVAAGVPTTSGTLNVGQTVSSTAGSWTVLHDPLGYSLGYQWQRCPDLVPANCVNIATATSSTYVLTATDYGKRVRVNVTATNADDTALQSSAISALVSQIPINNTLPTVSGTATQGLALTASQGTWTPADAVLTNVWLRCTTTLIGSCSTIAGQTGSTYTLAGADAGNYIRVQVTATTSAGPTVATSGVSGLVAADSDGDGVPNATDTCPSEAGTKPNGCLPSDIVGTVAPSAGATGFVVGDTAFTTTGTWTVLHDPLGYTLSYQWQRCTDLTVGSCSNIPGATAAPYVFVAGDYGKHIRVVITATNADDIEVQASTISPQTISQPPANLVLPTVTGTASVGQTLSGNQGLWSPGDALLSYSWHRCTDNVSGASCTMISGATNPTYTLTAADDNKYIRLYVGAWTVAGTSGAYSLATARVTTDTDGDGVIDSSDTCPAEAGTKPNGCLPSDIVAAGVPTMSGTLNVGQTASSTTGTWTVLHDPLGYTVSYQWQRCPDLVPANCVNIAGATSGTYVLSATDYGKRVRVNATATNADDTATQSSAISALVSQTPANTVAPSITGTPKVGQILTGAQGTWTPADATLTNAWLRCNDTTLGSCSTIAGQTGSTYTLVAADDSKYIRLQVSGATTAGTVVATSAATVQITTTLDGDGDGVPDATDTCPAEAGTKPNGCLPSDIVAAGVPTLSGTFNTGQSISSTTGTWTVLHDPLGYALGYQWQRCTTASTASCSNIATATSSTYTLVGADYGNRVRVNVTATNADDTAMQSSAISAAVSQLPANSALPSVSGTAKVGQVLTAGQGTWTPGDATLTNAWLRCTTTLIGSCTTIPGQTGATYTLVAADDGKYVRVQVTGATTAGTAVATSAGTAQVYTDTDGDGVVDGSDVCPAEAGTKPNGCLPSDIVGAGVPTTSGTLIVGQSVSSTTGSWTVLHDPLGYSLSYQWQRCPDLVAANCVNIAGATGNTYVLTAAEYGKRVRVNVTATNADDVALQSSSISALVSQNPVNNTLPTVTGTTRVGVALTAGQGTWTPADATLTNAWLRCTTTAIGSCTTIPGQTGGTYTLVAADDGKYIRVQVTGTTTASAAVATSAASAQVFTDTDIDGVLDSADTCPTEAGAKPNGCPPSDIVAAGLPTTSGTLNVGQTVSSTTGSWTVLHDPLGYALSYQWQRCPDLVAANCVNIAGATGSTYVLTAAEYGKRVRVNVTATNADDAALQSSAISGLVSQTPVNNTLPTVSGTAKVGQVITAGQGTWTPTDATLTNAWLRCTTTLIGSCTTIPGQTGGTYTLVAADDGKYVRVQVTGATTAGSAVATSAGTAQVYTDTDGDGVVDGSDVCPAEAGTKPNGCLPSVIVGSGLPTTSGSLVVGQTVSSTTGSWSVLHDQLGYTLTYQWQSCTDATTASCANIGGATATTYALTASELAKRVRVIVTATNADYSTAQASAISAAVIAAGSPPVNNTPPTVTGTTEVGQAMTATGTSSDWTPTSAVLTYAWLRCTDNASEASCVAIGSATASTYTLVSADSGTYIRVRVTATVGAQATDAASAPSAKVTTPVVTPPGGGTTTPPPPAVTNFGTITGPAKLKTIKPSKKGLVDFSKVSVYCGSKAPGNCTGTVLLTGVIGGKSKTLGTAKLSNLPGGGRLIAVKISKSALKALKKKPIKAQLAVSYGSPGATPAAYLGKVTLKKP